MAEFGNLAPRTSALFPEAGAMGRSLFVLSEAGNITSITAEVNMPDASYAAVRFAIYDDSNNLLAVSSDVWDVGTTGWQSVELAISYSAAAGNYYLAIQIQHDSIQLGAIAEASGAGIDVDGGNTWAAGAPDPFVIEFSRPANEQLCIYATYTPAASSPELININDDDQLQSLSTDNTLEVASLAVAYLSVGGVEVDNLAAVDADNYTFDMPFFFDGEAYPEFGTVEALAATGSDSGAGGYESATKNITLSLPDGWGSVVYGTLSTDSDSLAERIDGATIETGDTHYFIESEITIFDDSTFSGAPDGTIETWLRKSGTNVLILVSITNGIPDIDSTIAESVPAAVDSISATYAPVNFVASLSESLPAASDSISALLTIPEFSSVVVESLPAAVDSGSAFFGAQNYSGVLSEILPAANDSVIAASERPEFTGALAEFVPGAIDNVFAINGVIRVSDFRTLKIVPESRIFSVPINY